MSDFGAVYDYALMLEASVPAAAMAELSKVRPGVMGPPRPAPTSAPPAHAADDKKK